MLHALNNAGMFLIQTIFGLYIFILLLRLILQMVHADYYNPVSQMVILITQPFAKLLYIVILLIICTVAKLFLLVWMRTGVLPNGWGILIWSFGMLLEYLFNIFFYAILIRAILSWLGPHKHNAITVLLMQVTEPLLAPARKRIKPFKGFDFSPLVLLLLLQLLSILIAYPLMQLGAGL